ncbi:XdhC family protein [Celeribacter sp.]|uniref:XdhC family protein n=1 Tax=Celeribacter sp. TaxID=1890673 RepID=UPI003A91245B
MTQTGDAILETAARWARAEGGAALATVVQTWGSAPRPVGSQMAISAAGDMAGSVSGGCVEGVVVTEAMEMIEKGADTPRIMEFGVANEDAFAVGLACGGTIRVMIERIGAGLSIETLDAITEARRERRPVGYRVDPVTGAGDLVGPMDYPERFVSGKSGFEPVEGEEEGAFITVYAPPARIAIVGAVHVAQALVPMARIAGFDVQLIDPRGAFASQVRFPDEVVSDEWPDGALTAYGLDARTAVVTLTHDPKLDDPALMVALRSEAFYVGSLGSRRTHAKRVERLTQAGLDAAQIARLHAPVGLDIKAATPAEIAVSILAQIIEDLRRL